MKVEGDKEFARTGRALHGLSERELRLATYRGFRRAGKPLGEQMVQGGADSMPHHGGLAAIVARTQVSIGGESAGKNPQLEIRLQSSAGYDLAGLDDGEVHHPVFANPDRPRVFVTQRVTAGAFRRPFEDGKDNVERAVATEIRKAVHHAAGKA